jgi:mRNA interferase YafQ
MRMIEWTGQFKRDYKRERKGKHRATLDVAYSQSSIPSATIKSLRRVIMTML